MDRIVRGNIVRWSAIFIALAMTSDLCAQQVPSAEAVAEPQAAAEQIVVLLDGGILSGRVSRNGERYILARDKGETFIPVTNVMLVASSMEDAYQQRRQRISRPTSDQHLILAEWCLRHELIAHAHGELAAARALDARHDKLPMLERRLKLASDRLRTEKPPKSFEAPTPQAAAPITTNSETAFGELPPGTVERFTRKVQPVLVNSCTTIGCHQAGGTAKFQLDRALLRGMSNRRSTMNNLAATLALVDRKNPQLSPLLTVPRKTHGGLKGPVFGPRQEAAYRHLYEWVALLTAQSAKPSPTSPVSPAGDDELLVAKSDQPVTGIIEQAVHQESATPDDEAADPSNAAEADETSSPQALRYGTTLKRWLPRDEFDPEIFNRMHARSDDPPPKR